MAAKRRHRAPAEALRPGSGKVVRAGTRRDGRRGEEAGANGGSGDPRAFFAIALVIVGAGLVLRVIGLGHREFWHDEFCSLRYARAPEGTIRALRAGGNPPLYFLSLRGWMALFGASERAVRALSVLFSVASIGALGLWLRSLGLARRTVLWPMALASVTPLHLFYAREARGYSLVLLLVCLMLWSFCEALRRGGARWWSLHGALCLLGFYTHNLLVPFLAALWMAAGLRRAPRRAWAGLLAAHGAALALYAPWAVIAAGQAASGQARWIARFWEAYPPLLAIPRSLLAFGVGGPIPAYIAWPSPAPWISWLSALFFGAATLSALAAPASAARTPDGARKVAATSVGRRAIRELLVFLLAPLAGLWIASILTQPLYVVGRYDLVALPAFLGLTGVGLAELQKRLAQRLGPPSVAIPAAGVAILAAGALVPRYRADAAPDARPLARRADLLASAARPDDLIVSVDLAASNVLFLSRERGLPSKVATFPPEILAHWGWFNAEESAARGAAALRAEGRPSWESRDGPIRARACGCFRT